MGEGPANEVRTFFGGATDARKKKVQEKNEVRARGKKKKHHGNPPVTSLYLLNSAAPSQAGRTGRTPPTRGIRRYIATYLTHHSRGEALASGGGEFFSLMVIMLLSMREQAPSL